MPNASKLLATATFTLATLPEGCPAITAELRDYGDEYIARASIVIANVKYSLEREIFTNGAIAGTLWFVDTGAGDKFCAVPLGVVIGEGNIDRGMRIRDAMRNATRAIATMGDL